MNPAPVQSSVRPDACLFCGSAGFEVRATFDRRPDGETDWGLDQYSREVHECRGCGHFYAQHGYDLDQLYQGDYLDRKYQDLDGLKARAARILSLPPEESDNAGRVRRVVEFAAGRGTCADDARVEILDVGSGLCVFLARVRQETSWRLHAIDADERYLTHAATHFGVEAHESIASAGEGGCHYDIVAWNKVLEHILNPVSALVESLRLLAPDGFCYLELPDGEMAAREHGFDRAEFFIDHYHAFSAASLSLLIWRADAELVKLERVVDPSGKRTLAAFVARK